MRIGNVNVLRQKLNVYDAWDVHEPSGVREPKEEVLQELFQLNTEYEEKFEFIYIVSAIALLGMPDWIASRGIRLGH